MAGRASSWLTVALGAVLCLRTPVEAAPSELHQARAVAAAKPVAGYVYQGCHEEPSSGRALPSKTAQDGMTVELCASIAAGKAYFGLEFGRECWYGDTLSTDAVPAASEGDCSKPCSGDATELCGAGKRLNLYKKGLVVTSTTTSTIVTTASSVVPSAATSSSVTAPSYVSMGCYQDDASKNGRTLPDKKYANAAMTVEMCAAYAKSLKYQYFGLEYGDECWMANALNPLAQRSLPPDNPSCTTLCSGNASQLCGGRARMNLYSFLPAGSTSSATPSHSTSTSATATSSLGVSTASSGFGTSTSSVPASGSPSSTGSASATPVDLSKITLSDNAALATDSNGKAVVNLTPVAPGQASIQVPPSTLPAANPGDLVAVQVSYATIRSVKRAELAQCSLVIALGGVIIYNEIITTTDGNYTTVTVLTNYPTGPTTLIITENCPGSSATGITVGGVTVGPGGSTSSTSSSTPTTSTQPTTIPPASTTDEPSTTSLQTDTAVGPSSVPPTPSSGLADDQTSTGAPFTTPTLPVDSTTQPPPTTISTPSTSTTRAISDFYTAPPYTSGLCTRPTSFYTAGCTLSGAPLATSGLIAMASGIPNVKSYSSNGDESMSDEMCASFCASFDDCHSWVLDRGYNWPDDDGSNWWCYIYSGEVRQYAVSYDSTFRQLVWNGRGCYDCHGFQDPASSTTPTLPPVPATTEQSTAAESTSYGPSSTAAQTQPSTDSSVTPAPVTASAPVPTVAAAPYTASTCTEVYPYRGLGIECTISGYPTPSATATGLLSVMTGVPPAPASAGRDFDSQYQTCAGGCANTDGCISWVLDTGDWPWITNDGVVLHNWTCLFYDLAMRPYLHSADSSQEADRYIWQDSQCFTCSSVAPKPSSSTEDTSSAAPSTTGPLSSSSTTQLSTITTSAPVTTPPAVPTFAAAQYTASTCSDNDIPYMACTMSGWNTPSATAGGLLAVMTGVAPPPADAGHNYQPQYETCAGGCANTDGCLSYVVDTGGYGWVSGDVVLHNWTCLFYDFPAEPYIDANDNLAIWDRYIWMESACFSCDAVAPEPTSSSPQATSSGPATSTTASVTTGSTTDLATTSLASIPTFLAPAVGARTCSHPSGVWTNPCSITGYPTATSGLIAVATGLAPPPSGSYNFEAENQACAAACSDAQGCTGYAMELGQWPRDMSDWTCLLYSIDVRTFINGPHPPPVFGDTVVWMDSRCYDCQPSQLTTSMPLSSTATATSGSSTATATPSITAPPVPTIAAPPYETSWSLCGGPNGGACSISGFPTATTSLLAVVTAIPAPDPDTYYPAAQIISCELACLDTQNCTGFALDRGAYPRTDPWSCYLYNVNVDTYLRGAQMGQDSNQILWFDKNCYNCYRPSTISTTSIAASTLSSNPTTTQTLTPSYTSNTASPTGTDLPPSCTRVANPDPSLSCNIRGFALPAEALWVSPADTVDDCSAFCHWVAANNATNCVSQIWDPSMRLCKTFSVEAWDALGDQAPAGALWRNNVMDDSGCWDCVPSTREPFTPGPVGA